MAGRFARLWSGSLGISFVLSAGIGCCVCSKTRGSVAVVITPVGVVFVVCDSGSRPASLMGKAIVQIVPSVVGSVCWCWSALGLTAFVVAPVGVVSWGVDCELGVVTRGLGIFKIMLSNSSRSRVEKVLCSVWNRVLVT